MAYTTIKKPSDYFNTKLYTGNGSTQSITGVGFQPDWTWLKQRNGTSNHRCYDAVRSATKQIYPNLTNAENTETNGLTSFDSDGFSLGNEGGHNGSGQTFASWNWLANGAGSSNTDGSITSTVSANTTSGFSIVSYTGTTANATVGHGLGSTPKVVIVKRRTGSTSDWICYFETLGNTKRLVLNSSSAVETATTWWNSTNPSSSVFYLGSSSGVNESSQSHIAYCFAEKTGYSKFGSYTGNGNNDGTFVYTGFKPAFVIVKRTDGLADWNMYDNKRIGYNPLNYFVYPNLSNAEDTSNPQWFDLHSNGFKLRNTSAISNVSGGSYIYMAFAEEPLVGDNPATAR